MRTALRRARDNSEALRDQPHTWTAGGLTGSVGARDGGDDGVGEGGSRLRGCERSAQMWTAGGQGGRPGWGGSWVGGGGVCRTAM